MTYALSFARDFFWGDPSGSQEQMDSSKHPTSVCQAIISISQQEFRTLAREVFHTEPECLDVATVIEKIRETNTCRNLNSPVEVFIDPDGNHSILVYDPEESVR
jgi:hypothetical protein